MNYTATYSPEDNKLRLYSSARLSKELYDRVKAAGFKWAPKQELFVAPMWTPGREDFLLELCGEIDDEDTTLVDRAEERSERFSEYSDKRTEDATRAFKAVEAITEHIPLGQPILVGHHSERRARKDAERIDTGMRRAVKMWDTAKYWEDRAAGALRHAKYKELPAVRARRIKTIEADLRKQQRYLSDATTNYKAWAACEAIEDAEAQKAAALKLANNGASFRLARKEGDKEDWSYTPSVYDALTNAFPNLYAPRTLEEIFAAAHRAYPPAITRAERWIQHYTNRIAYERAMLAETGGTATDKTGPQKGGGCKCWSSPNGGWSYIQKVNKVSVSVLDNYGNGGGNFTRTMPFDKLSAVMTAAEVAELKATGELIESADGTGFFVTRKPTTPTPAPETEETPAAAAAPEEEGAEDRPSLGESIAAIRDSLKKGVQIVAAPQLFPTPAHLAARMVELADIQPGHEVLEPSAGTGILCKAITTAEPTARVFAVELNHRLCDVLSQTITPAEDRAEGICKNVLQGDFLECDGLGKFERIVMNPPFANGDDIRHITHARTMLKPGGRLVAICANGPRQNATLRPLVEACGGFWEELAPETFRSSGTGVNTVLLTLSAAQ